MRVVRSPLELQRLLQDENKSIGFIPTMGALHLGHRTLIAEAKKNNELVVVSIFVNPTQFLQGEDLDAYPRKEEADKKICELAGVDYLYYPDTASMYEDDEASVVAPQVRAYILEGSTRPGHFNGVLTVVLKLLNIVQPTRAYFGKKDAQQLMLIQTMVKNFFMSVEIVAVDTVRESDGLAMSSRNVYLDTQQRKEAQKISLSLKKATQLIMQNNLDVVSIKTAMNEVLTPLQVEHIAIVSRDFKPLKTIELQNSIILVEALVGKTRLLDNLWI